MNILTIQQNLSIAKQKYLNRVAVIADKKLEQIDKFLIFDS